MGFKKLFADKSTRWFLIGGIIGILLLIWLLPTIVGMVFGFIWFVVKLPFNLLHLIFVTGVGGFFQVIWNVFSGFFEIFGPLGRFVMWLVLWGICAFVSLVGYRCVRTLNEGRRQDDDEA